MDREVSREICMAHSVTIVMPNSRPAHRDKLHGAGTYLSDARATASAYGVASEPTTSRLNCSVLNHRKNIGASNNPPGVTIITISTAIRVGLHCRVASGRRILENMLKLTLYGSTTAIPPCPSASRRFAAPIAAVAFSMRREHCREVAGCDRATDHVDPPRCQHRFASASPSAP